MTLTLELDAELEKHLTQQAKQQGLSVESVTTNILHQALSPAERAAKVGALLRSWLVEDDQGEQKETWDYLVKALDEDRSSDRKLFPPELKGSSW